MYTVLNLLPQTHGGRLPLEIRAVPEGTVLPTGNVLFTVENTDPKVHWTQDSANCTLHTENCTVYTAHCTLYTTH